MESLIYGIDPTGTVTADMVRDALVECFYEAHCMATELPQDNPETSRQYCRLLVEKAFTDVGGDINHPTRNSIQQVMGKLADIAKNFRSQDIIRKHQAELELLVSRIP